MNPETEEPPWSALSSENLPHEHFRCCHPVGVIESLLPKCCFDKGKQKQNEEESFFFLLQGFLRNRDFWQVSVWRNQLFSSSSLPSSSQILLPETQYYDISGAGKVTNRPAGGDFGLGTGCFRETFSQERMLAFLLKLFILQWSICCHSAMSKHKSQQDKEAV